MSNVIRAAEEARLDSLDKVLDNQQPVESLAADLFAVVDAVDGQPALRRALTDPGTPVEGRQHLVRSLFGGKISDEATTVVAEAASQRWSTGREFTNAIERQGVRSQLLAAQNSGQLDDVEDQLFRFERLVAGEPRLRDALSDRAVPMDGRRELVRGLLEGKASPVTVTLAQRAVAARERTFANTVESFLTLAAKLRSRTIATVVVAKPLDQEQIDRLRAALGRQVGHEVDVHVIVDPKVIGGIRVELGDEVIEGTVSSRLEDARRRFQ